MESFRDLLIEYIKCLLADMEGASLSAKSDQSQGTSEAFRRLVAFSSDDMCEDDFALLRNIESLLQKLPTKP